MATATTGRRRGGTREAPPTPEVKSGNGAVPPERALAVVKERYAVIERSITDPGRVKKLMEVMPPGMDASRFVRATLTAISRNPDLLACTPESIVTAVFDAAEAGLTPTGSLNRAWLVPYKNKGVLEAQLEIGYEGYADLIRNGMGGGTVASRAVFEGDTFAVEYGTKPFIHHVPAFMSIVPADLTHVYAVVTDPAGDVLFEVMTKGQVEAIRARAKMGNSGAWITDYVQQARKTVIRRVAHYLTLTVGAQNAMAKQDARENAPREVDSTSQTVKVREKLQQQLAGKVAAQLPAGPTASEAPGGAEEPPAPNDAAPVAPAQQQPPAAAQQPDNAGAEPPEGPNPEAEQLAADLYGQKP